MTDMKHLLHSTRQSIVLYFVGVARLCYQCGGVNLSVVSACEENAH